MDIFKARALREEVAAQVCQKLTPDRERISAPVRRFVEELEARFGEHELSLGDIYQLLGGDEDTLRRAFGLSLGMPPQRFLKMIRLSVAAKLLETTSLSVTLTSELVGYSSLKMFGKAFKEHFGMSPSAYRRRHGGGQEMRGAAFPPDLAYRLDELRLEESHAQSLMSYLRSHHPEVVEDDRSVGFADAHSHSTTQKRRITNPELEGLLAERLWCAIESLPQEAQCERIHLASLFTLSTPALFEFLKEKSLEVGRTDRPKGVAVAELALIAAQAYERPDPVTGTSTLWARAWAALGNMRRLAFDLENAERAFLQAEHFLPDDPDPRVLGRLLNLKALLRWYQQAYPDGLSLVDRAIVLLEKVDDAEALAKVLIDRAILCRYMGRLKSGVETLRRALDILPKLTNDHRLHLAAYYNLARYYRELGSYPEVEAMLKTLRGASARSNLHVYDVYIDWFEGRVALDQEDPSRAERSLLAAHSGFLLAGAKARAGFVALDLAITYTLQEKKIECVKSSQEALTALDLWRANPTLEQAWRTLKRSVITRTFCVSDLAAVRDAIDHFQDDPMNERYVELSLAG